MSAPAGSGKTTAIASWSQNRPELAHSWVQVDEADDDPTRFWSCIIDALSVLDPSLPEVLRPDLLTPMVRMEDAVVPANFPAIEALPGPEALVIDDLHLITAPEVLQSLHRFLETIPQSAVVVLATRIGPPLRIGRLRVEGWAAGLALAATSLARTDDPAAFVNGFAGDDHLVDELLQDLDPADRTRMLETSVLDQMTGDLVDAVTGTTGGHTWLENLAHDNQLVVSLDPARTWFPTTTFSGICFEPLTRTGDQVVSDLHQRAAKWYAAAGEAAEAIDHAARGGHEAFATELLAHESSTKVFSEGQLATVRRWVDSIGPGAIGANPGAALIAG